MDVLDQASLRVVRWRVDGLPTRLGQALLIGGLLWLQSRAASALWWTLAAFVTAMVDAQASRLLLGRLGDWRLSVLTAVTRTISAGAFTLVCFVILIDRSGFALPASMLVACASTLNNVVMTRGSRRAFLSL